MTNTAPKTAAVAILLHQDDNVVVLGKSVLGGESIALEGGEVRFAKPVGIGHKIARRDIATGEKILKYGAPIGSATVPIRKGEHVHLHNMRSDYLPTFTLDGEKFDH